MAPLLHLGAFNFLFAFLLFSEMCEDNWKRLQRARTKRQDPVRSQPGPAPTSTCWMADLAR